MQKATAQQSMALPATSAAHYLPAFTPLEQVTRPTVPTADAAYYLNRQPQSLRAWACHMTGPLTPLRIGSRLAWRVADIKKLLGMA